MGKKRPYTSIAKGRKLQKEVVFYKQLPIFIHKQHPYIMEILQYAIRMKQVNQILKCHLPIL